MFSDCIGADSTDAVKADIIRKVTFIVVLRRKERIGEDTLVRPLDKIEEFLHLLQPHAQCSGSKKRLHHSFWMLCIYTEYLAQPKESHKSIFGQLMKHYDSQSIILQSAYFDDFMWDT